MRVTRILADAFLLGALMLAGWLALNSFSFTESYPGRDDGDERMTEIPDGVSGDSLPVMALMADRAVVEIEGDTPSKQITGTGFFISSSGLVLTNRHVMEDPLARYWIVAADGTRHRVERVVMSRDADLALVETEARNTPWLALSQENVDAMGQPVVMVNSGPIRPASFGEVGGRKPMLLTDGNTIERDVIQIDAQVRPGDSGSPLLDSRGQVIGVIFAYDYSKPDVGFAVPVSKAKDLLEAYAREM